MLVRGWPLIRKSNEGVIKKKKGLALTISWMSSKAMVDMLKNVIFDFLMGWPVQIHFAMTDDDILQARPYRVNEYTKYTIVCL